MDEILSSIRKIIETGEPAPAASDSQPSPQGPRLVDAAEEEAEERTPMSGDELDRFAQALDARAPGSVGLIDSDDIEAAIASEMALNDNVTVDQGKYEARFSEDDSRAFAEVASVLSASTAGIGDQADATVVEDPASDTPQREADSTNAIPSGAPVPATTGPLLSTAVQQSVSASFDTLTDSLKQHAGRDLQSLTEDMLRPMLADWLDNNLPAMVERLVRIEIERIARGDPRQF